MIKLGFCLLYRLYTFIYPVYYGLCHLCPKSPAFPGFFTFFSGVGGRGRSPLIFAHRNFCTQKLLHRSLCTEASLHEVKSWNWKKFFRKNPSQELSGTHLLPKKVYFQQICSEKPKEYLSEAGPHSIAFKPTLRGIRRSGPWASAQKYDLIRRFISSSISILILLSRTNRFHNDFGKEIIALHDSHCIGNFWKNSWWIMERAPPWRPLWPLQDDPAATTATTRQKKRHGPHGRRAALGLPSQEPEEGVQQKRPEKTNGKTMKTTLDLASTDLTLGALPHLDLICFQHSPQLASAPYRESDSPVLKAPITETTATSTDSRSWGFRPPCILSAEFVLRSHLHWVSKWVKALLCPKHNWCPPNIKGPKHKA